MKGSNISLEETLLPVLLKCFGIIFLGYVLGKFGILGRRESKGLAIFVQYLALPALIFSSMSTISFSHVKWGFLASIFVAKVCIFVCVVLMSMLLTHPTNLEKSGIYAIATTQSNDFALAFPVFNSLYKNSHPEYPSYLYLIAPIQLLILNTLGFFIIETQQTRLDNLKHHFLHVLKKTFKNPIVFMTLVGLMWNIILKKQNVPMFNDILEAFSSAFPATALLLIGHTMAIKHGKTCNQIPITVALLIITKNLILPIILQKITTFMLNGSSQSEIECLSSFGFLYGTTPTAPSAYVFAIQYDISIDVIAKTIIGSTLVSVPIMFASASVISMCQMGIKNISYYLSLTIRYLSCANLFCCILLLFLFFIGKRFHNISFGVTIYILLAQFLTAIGGIMLFFSKPDHSVLFYAQYIFTNGGIYATRICTLFLAILLIIMRWRSLCFILQIKKNINIASVLCLTLPFGLASLLLAVKDAKGGGPNYQLGYAQVIATFTITLLCFIGTCLCLILQHVCFRKKCNENRQSDSFIQSSAESESIISPKNSQLKSCRYQTIGQTSLDVEDLATVNSVESENLISEYVENSLCGSSYQCSTERRLQCANRISVYNQHIKEDLGMYDDQIVFQHTILLIALIVSMTVSLTVCFWKLILEEINGIFNELELLDVAINYSIGILCFIIFGIDKDLLSKICKKLKKLKCIGKRSEISPVEICEIFRKKYEQKCRNDIGKTKIIDSTEHDYVFCSSDIIEWLIENEIVKSEDEAEIYISHLLDQHLIEKIDPCSYFPTHASIYKFKFFPSETDILVI